MSHSIENQGPLQTDRQTDKQEDSSSQAERKKKRERDDKNEKKRKEATRLLRFHAGFMPTFAMDSRFAFCPNS